METNQLTFEHICFKYKGNDNQLFTDLDVTMETGQVVGILGASGSGKTTLTEILLGQLKPTCQQFRILENGKPVTAGSRSWSYVHNKISYVSTSRYLRPLIFMRITI